jgi:zinc transport system substrate-binding protein
MQFVLRLMLIVGIFWLAQGAAAETPLRVLTSIKPLQLIAVAVGGEAIRADALLDPQFSPHDYQLRPSDRKKLNDADVVFWIGPSLEAFLQSPLNALSGRATVISLQDSEEDPHIWMDPVAAAQIAHRMAQALAALRPQRRMYFESNAARLAQALMQQDSAHRAQLKQLSSRRGFMVSHDAYSRFERRYDLMHRAALTNASDMPPSAKSLVNIERQLADGSIACIWRQPIESSLYQRLVAKRNIRAVTIDAMAAQIPVNADGVLQFYQRLWETAIACLAD